MCMKLNQQHIAATVIVLARVQVFWIGFHCGSLPMLTTVSNMVKPPYTIDLLSFLMHGVGGVGFGISCQGSS